MSAFTYLARNRRQSAPVPWNRDRGLIFVSMLPLRVTQLGHGSVGTRHTCSPGPDIVQVRGRRRRQMDEKRRSNTFWVYRAGELGTVLGLEVGADRTSQAIGSTWSP